MIHVIQSENDPDAIANLQMLYKLPKAAEYFSGGAAAPEFEKARSQKLSVLQALEVKFRNKPATPSGKPSPEGSSLPAPQPNR